MGKVSNKERANVFGIDRMGRDTLLFEPMEEMVECAEVHGDGRHGIPAVGEVLTVTLPQ
nr:hypothetical protein [Thiohalomonas denitrificans]